MYYYNISSTPTDSLSTECLWSNSRTQTHRETIAPHWSSSYPEYLSPDQDQGEQRKIVWSRLHDHRANLANRLARTRDRYLEARRALNPRTTQVESSHDPLYRDNLSASWGTSPYVALSLYTPSSKSLCCHETMACGLTQLE